MTIATLIAAGRLDERLLGAALARLPDARVHGWVEPGEAVDLDINAPSEAIRQTLEGWEGVDIVALPPGPRSKGLFVADMDSTMIGQECIDELADYAGVKPLVAEITERAMRGELDFVGALKERVALLKDLPEETLARCLEERVRANPGAATLVRTLDARGCHTLLVSGGFTSFAVPVAAQLGFAEIEANTLEVREGRLTGRVSGDIVESSRKLAALENARERLSLPSTSVMAIGDGANDRPMVEAAGLGIAYRSKPILAEAADARLDHHPLDALLWALGIPRSQWIAV